MKEWLGKHSRHHLTSIIWSNLGKLNKVLGYGTNRPPRSMVETKRHYAEFFQPIFLRYKSDVSAHPGSFTNVHRKDYEEALELRVEASKYLVNYASRIKAGILDTGMSGGRGR